MTETQIATGKRTTCQDEQAEVPDGNSPERNWHQAGASSEFEYPIIIREKWPVNQWFLIFADCSLVRILRDIRASFPD